jgi:hypothetical protein
MVKTPSSAAGVQSSLQGDTQGQILVEQTASTDLGQRSAQARQTTGKTEGKGDSRSFIIQPSSQLSSSEQLEAYTHLESVLLLLPPSPPSGRCCASHSAKWAEISGTLSPAFLP